MREKINTKKNEKAREIRRRGITDNDIKRSRERERHIDREKRTGRETERHSDIVREKESDRGGVKFINILLVPFSYQSILCSFSLITVWLCNFWAQEYLRKSCSQNVDEIDYRSGLSVQWSQTCGHRALS